MTGKPYFEAMAVIPPTIVEILDILFMQAARTCGMDMTAVVPIFPGLPREPQSKYGATATTVAYCEAFFQDRMVWVADGEIVQVDKIFTSFTPVPAKTDSKMANI